MRLFLIRTGAFLAIMVILLGLGMYIHKGVMRHIVYQVSDDTHTLLMGDSHVMLGVNPAYISGSVNVAKSAETLGLTYQKIKFIHKQNPQIRRVLIGVGYHSFSDALYTTRFHDADTMHTICKEYSPMLDYQMLRVYMGSWKKLFINCMLRNYYLISREKLQQYKALLDSDAPPFIDGYTAYNGGFQNKHLNKILSLHFHADTGTDSPHISPYAHRDLINIMEYTDASHLDLWIVFLPVHHEYSAKTPEQYQRNVDALIDTLSTDHRFRVVKMSLSGEDDAFFRDYDHMSSAGAEEISIQIQQLWK